MGKQLFDAISDEVMSIMREHSVDAGYKTVRIGIKALTGEVKKTGNVTDADVDKAIAGLIEDGYLVKNGQYTVDVGKNDYFAVHQRDPDAIKSLTEAELPEVAEVEEAVTVKPDLSHIATTDTSRPAGDELRKALDDLELRLAPVKDKQTKLDVLSQVAKYLHPSIAAVLDDIAEIIEAMEAE